MQSESQGGTAFAQLSVAPNTVLRNTYLLLGLSMLPTVLGAAAGLSMNFLFMAQHPFLFALGSFAIMMAFFAGIAANRNNALGVLLLLVLTGFLGLLLGPILQVALHMRNGGQIVGLAAGGTGVIFMSLATVATVTKKDFGFLGNFLFVGLILLVVASLVNAFLHIPALALTLSVVSILVFSGYILFDVSRIVQGGETNYVMATLQIYLDIYNLFINLLSLLMALLGNRD